RQAFAEFLHELVVDAKIGEIARQRAGPGPDGRTKDRIQENEANKHAPEAAARSTHGGQINSLVKFHLPFRIARDDDDIFHSDKILLLQLRELGSKLEGGGLVVESNRYQISHVFLLFGLNGI